MVLEPVPITTLISNIKLVSVPKPTPIIRDLEQVPIKFFLFTDDLKESPKFFYQNSTYYQPERSKKLGVCNKSKLLLPRRKDLVVCRARKGIVCSFSHSHLCKHITVVGRARQCMHRVQRNASIHVAPTCSLSLQRNNAVQY